MKRKLRMLPKCFFYSGFNIQTNNCTLKLYNKMYFRKCKMEDHKAKFGSNEISVK